MKPRYCQVQRVYTTDFYEWDSKAAKNRFTHTQSNTKRCGNMLIAEESKLTGICLSCTAGWATREDHPSVRGLQQIQKAKR